MEQCLLRLPEVVAITCRSKAQIYRDAARGQFPLPVKLGPKSSAWRLAEIQSWLDRLAPAKK